MAMSGAPIKYKYMLYSIHENEHGHNNMTDFACDNTHLEFCMELTTARHASSTDRMSR